jgi:hypothetical protein
MIGNSPILDSLPGLEVSALALRPKVSAPLECPKSIPTKTLSANTGIPMSQISETSAPPISVSEFEQRAGVLMCLRVECLASLLHLSDKCAELLTNAGSGLKASEWCANYDPASRSLRTRQASLFSKKGEPGTELCQDWSRSGMICSGMYFPQPRLVQDICENVSSLSLPTPDTQPHRKNPNANAKKWGGNNSIGSYARAKLLPTPTGRDFKDTPNMARTAKDGRERDDQLPRRIYGDVSPAPTGGMRLTPEFQCWLMGFPPDWLKPLRAALETQSSRKSRSASRAQSERHSHE